MNDLFLKTISISMSANCLILAVMLLRLVLRKAPRWIHVLLWGIVAVRLICPISIESAFSLIPEPVSSGTLINEWSDDYVGNNHFIHENSEYYRDAIAAGREPISDGTGGYYVATGSDRVSEPTTVRNTVVPVLSIVWAIGWCVMALYTAISYLSLRTSLKTAVILQGNIFQCETVSSPFVLGILKPKIYLPYAMDDQNLKYVVAHEQAHIRRKDHWWKPLGFLLLSIHWFNPLMWIAYIMLCRDIELACDEKVIAELDNGQKADYTQALVSCAVTRRMIAACPLAFGEVGVKDRVKSVMNYKKPSFWIILGAVIICVIVALCFLTNPLERSTSLSSGVYHIADTLYSHTPSGEKSFAPADSYYVTTTFQLIVKSGDGPWNILGTMEPYPLTNDELNSYNLEGWHRRYPVKKITDAYILREEDEFFYLVFQTKDGNSYLAYGWEDTAERGQAGSDDTGLRRLFQLEWVSGSCAVVWFDYTDNPSQMSYEEELKIQLDVFPGITFKYTPYDIVATTSWEDSDLVGRTVLISGLPIWNAYFYDITGDGKDEICSQVSYGSGMIDNRVIIFDYANGVSYKLEDRGHHDYYLRMNDVDGYLYVDKRVYNSDELVSSGRLVFKDGCIQIEGADNEPVEEKPQYDRIVISHESKADKKAAVTVTDDAAISQILSMYESLEIEEYGRPLAEERLVLSFFDGKECKLEWYVSFYREDDEIVTCCDGFGLGNRRVTGDFDYDHLLDLFKQADVKMIPTNTDLVGLPAGALLVPIDGNVYRYELSEGDPEGLTVDELLYTFTEETPVEGIAWEVYSLKEYPDKTAVLMRSGTNSTWLCRYSPPARCSEYALNQAMAAGYVIMEDGIATSGQGIWNEFYDMVQQEKAASVTVVHYFTLDPERCDSAYYEVYSQDYPCLYECRLDYDGKTFTLTEPDGNEVRIRTFEYLMKYDNTEFYSQSSKTTGRRFDYVLTHDNRVTWEQIWNGLISSYTGADIDHYSIYSERIQ